MIDVLQKRKQAKQILNEVEIEAELMYESVSEAIKDINLPNYKLDYQLLEKIDNFLKLYAIINKEQYILNGELINYKLEIIEPLQNVIDMNEEYNPFMEIEEIEELEELKHFYDFHIIFVLYFKWHITKELQDLNLLVDYFIYYFDGSNIFPIDINEYSKNQQIEGSSEYIKLSKMVRNIKDYLDDYEPYMTLLNDYSIKESPYNNKINYSDFLAGRTGLYWGESWIRGCGANFILDFECNPEKYDSLINSENLSYENYYSLTRDLTEEEKEETGKFAYIVIINNLEAINILSHLLKYLCENDSNYIEPYRILRIQMERIFKLANIFSFDYYDDSEVEKIELTATEYKHQLLLKMSSKLITAFANDNIDNLTQIKKDLIPLYKYDAPWLLQQFEESINEIANKLITTSNENKQTKILEADIDKVFNSNKGYSIVRDEIISTLTTAEFLYKKYILEQAPDVNWDYSFISILYYQVLEKSLNILIYKPYIQEIGNGPFSEKDIQNYFGKARCSDKKKNNFFAKDSLELGVCGFLLSEAKYSNNFSRFLRKKYPNYNLINIEKIADTLKNTISIRRNDAAHPKLIEYKVAKEDKLYIYSGNSYKESIELHDMFEFLLVSLLN